MSRYKNTNNTPPEPAEGGGPQQSGAISRLLGEKTVAEILNIEVATLRRWRWAGKGPQFLKIGAAVRYAPHSLEDYLVAAQRTSTSDLGSGAAK